MPLGEDLHHQKIIERINYTDNSRSPFQVVESTAKLLDLYFTPVINLDPSLARNYFANATLGFAWQAEKGFFKNIDKIDRAKKISNEDIERFILLDKQQGQQENVEDNEAFDFTLITFGFMPEMAKHRFLPNGFSKKGMMAPPFTTREYLLRLREIRREVTRIISGETDQKASLDNNPALLRTYWFFQVGKEIPLKIKKDYKNIKNNTEKILNKLLEDIDIN
ncbi:hypothetical protein LBMAG33_3480 [Candidatus Levyibacteriota bacterium]|nr:hypothetical protein [Candidatus Levybacteria bacterium]GDX62038.1 hypothetical protein LBMAG33_3480 [Candidatus Levybacteria bacterium]